MPDASIRTVPRDPALPLPAWTERLPRWAGLAALAAATWALRAVGLLLLDAPGGFAVVWPASGLAVYALLVARRRSWPVVAAVPFAVGVVGSLSTGRSAAEAVALNLANAVEALAAAWLVVRVGGRPTLRTLRGALALTFAPALAVGAVSALSHLLLAAGPEPFAEQRFWVFWGGSSLGIVLVTALLVEWTEPPGPFSEGPGAPFAAAGIALTFAGALALLRVPGLPVHDVVLLPPLLWAAVRFGARGVTLALALGVAAFLVAGPGTRAAGDDARSILAVQVFVGVGSASLLAVAAVGEERHRAERRRIIVERAMDRSPDPAGVFDEEGRFVWGNEAAARLFRTARGALVGRTLWSLLGDTRERWRARWDQVAQAGSLVGEQRLGARTAGAPYEVSAAVVDVSGQALMVAVLRDLTDRRRAEEASRLAALGTLAAGVAHEINNPLAYVVSNLAHVKERLEPWPDPDGRHRTDVLEPLSEAEEGARRVRDIVRQLRAFARADEGSAPVDPGRALRAALAMAQNEVRHRARLTTDLAVTPPVIASENRLTQVFVNLLVNAAQAIPEGSADRNEVRAALFSRDGEVVAEISDSGAGMAPETRARIFEPFYTTKAPGVGTGLGLAISHSIVTGLGGRIEVESAPGEGSLFRVVLPASGGTGAVAA